MLHMYPLPGDQDGKHGTFSSGGGGGTAVNGVHHRKNVHLEGSGSWDPLLSRHELPDGVDHSHCVIFVEGTNVQVVHNCCIRGEGAQVALFFFAVFPRGLSGCRKCEAQRRLVAIVHHPARCQWHLSRIGRVCVCVGGSVGRVIFSARVRGVGMCTS